MKSLLILFTALFALFTSTAADFHVGYYGTIGNMICPSNYFNCDCMVNGKRSARIQPNIANLYNTGHFSATNVCGAAKIDFWKRDDGHLDMYHSGGNGNIIGQCWRGDTETSCLGGRVNWRTWYWCYSSICGK
ncbi:hypothetical protein ACJ41O_014391 [Fusarium nematophilum]